METSVEEVEQRKDLAINGSLGMHEENKEKGVRLEKLKLKEKAGEVLVKDDFMVG